MGRATGVARLTAWVAGVVAVLVVLHGWRPPAAATGGGPAAPADVLAVLLAGARLVALACAWYLAAATLLVAVGEVVRSRRLRGAADRVALPLVRRVVRAGVGAGLAVGIGLGPIGVAAAAPGPPGATADRIEVADPPATAERPGATGADVAGAAEPRPSGDGARAHEVAAGESFWSIAEDLVADHLGRAPDDAEVVATWRALVAANRDRLVVADDPDLLLPGQRLVTVDVVERR